MPVAPASSSWSAGHSGSGSSRPVTTGLNARTGSPRARSVVAIDAATTVLPTPVSVPVTKTPLGGNGVERTGVLGGGQRHAGAGPEARVQRGPPEDPRGVAQLGLRVRR